MTDSPDRIPMLREVAGEIAAWLGTISRQDYQSLIEFENYHGFQKAALYPSRAPHIFGTLAAILPDVQCEIVEVRHDLSAELHYHEWATAYAVCLGAATHVAPPHLAQVFLADHWAAIQKEGESFLIPPRTLHGFTVAPSGTLTFLSVQSPPVSTPNYDDYVRAVEKQVPFSGIMDDFPKPDPKPPTA